MDKNINIQKLSTQELTLLVEQSLGKTEAIESSIDTREVINTEISQLPIRLSAGVKLNKATDLDGGITKTVGVTIGGDNLVYANVRVSGEEGNAVMVNDDGLYVPPINNQSQGGIDIEAFEQLFEQKKQELVLRNYNGVLFKYEHNAFIININGVDKVRVSENGVDFLI